MSRKSFQSPDEALEYMMTLSDDSDEESDAYEHLVIVPPAPDSQSDEEDLDEDATMQPEERELYDDPKVSDIPGTIEVLRAEKGVQFPKHACKWSKRKPIYSSLPTVMQDNVTVDLKEKLRGSTPVSLLLKMASPIIDKIVEETNRYAKQKNNSQVSVSDEDIRIFIGILLFTGYHYLPRQTMYWEQSQDCNTRIVSDAMSKNRYKEIKKYLHFNDNDNIDKADRYYKIRPLYNLLNDAVQQFGVFVRELTIDERMVKYYGRHGLKMYMKGKPVKFGYKIWVLAGYDGFPFNFLLYEPGAQKTLSVSEFVVSTLLNVVEDKKCHPVYMDNFFSSYSLAASLRKEGVFMTGTVRENRIASCPLMPSKEMKKGEKGISDSRFDSNAEVAVVRWNDNKCVSVISNFEDVASTETVSRRAKGSSRNVPIPAAIKSYNKYKDGVDLFDGLMACYPIRIQGKKWYCDCSQM